MKTFKSKNGEWKVKQTFMENVQLRRGGSLSLYWVENCISFKALILRRYKGKFFGSFIPSWTDATHEFHERIAREGKKSKDPRTFHTIALRTQPNDIGFRCLAICKNSRLVADVEHLERIGSMALAFREINRMCGVRHRKEYDILEHIYPKEKAYVIPQTEVY
jgi:hypothetical protein